MDEIEPSSEAHESTGPVEPAGPIASTSPVIHRFEFSGQGSEYFRIWIVNLALTIVTIGIYSAWAKVRRLKYMHGATTLDGSAFGYHGAPQKILKGRMIGAVLFGGYVVAGRVNPVAGLIAGLVLTAAFPWLIVKSMKFRTRMTSWRGLRLDFNQDFKGAYATYFGWLLLTIVSLGLLMPMFVRKFNLFIVNNTRVGSTAFVCRAKTAPFYFASLQALGVIFAGGVLLVIVITVTSGLFDQATAKTLAATVLPLLVIGPVYVLAIAVFQSATLNEVFGTTTFGPHQLQCRLSGPRLASIYLTNLLGIVCTLGLFTPWATVRLLRYRLESMSVAAEGSLDRLVAAETDAVPGAIGEEISDIFDVDFGL